MSLFRTLALIFIFGPLAAMFSEPFFSGLFDRFGWDTEDWVDPAMNWVASNSPVWLFMIAFGLGVWCHYLMGRLLNSRALIHGSTQQASHGNPDECQFQLSVMKHIAPNQENIMISGGYRICAGFQIEGNDFTANHEFEITLKVHDENGWQFYDEDWLAGPLARGKLKSCYPIEICKSDQEQIVYAGGHQDTPRVLPLGKHITFQVEIYVEGRLCIEQEFYLFHTPPSLRFEFDSELPEAST